MPLSESEIAAYFANPNNYANKPISEVVQALGAANNYDDWDWGRYVYEWRGENIRYIVVTRGGYVKAVEALDPNDKSRFGTTLRVLWGDSSP